MEKIDVFSVDGRAKIEHVLIMVHGIRDFGSWLEELDQALPNDGIAAVGIRYGYFDLFRFLFPVPWFRKAVVNKVAQRVRDAQSLYPNARFSYLAHSFGTYVVGKMLLSDPNFRAKRIVFCGSVLPEDFPVSQLRCNFDAPLLNDVGTRDLWPILARSVTWGYGSAGSNGFGQPYVEDRFHDHGHGGFLTNAFASENWVDFLKSGKVKDGIVPPPAGIFRRILVTFQLKYLAIIGLGVLAYLPWNYGPEGGCVNKWLNLADYETCFQGIVNESVESYLVPIAVGGRVSWFGFGEDVFFADWVFMPGYCFYSSVFLSRAELGTLNRDLTGGGYAPVSVRNFTTSEEVVIYQATWIKDNSIGTTC